MLNNSRTHLITSCDISHLKQKAKKLKKTGEIKHTEALDQVAREFGEEFHAQLVSIMSFSGLEDVNTVLPIKCWQDVVVASKKSLMEKSAKPDPKATNGSREK